MKHSHLAVNLTVCSEVNNDGDEAAFARIVGHSLGLRNVLQLVEMVAATDATVLLLGETGTGKELIARAIHEHSQRQKQSFVTLNCRTASDCSVNYSVQEFANDIVCTINEICLSENVPPPTIVTESGRAVVAHHAMFITNVIRTLKPGLGGTEISPAKVDSEVVREMMDLHKDINPKNFREYYHDALQHREELQSLFNLGYLNLQNRAHGEWLFWEICRKAIKFSRSMKERPEEFADLENILASKYICNFSVFQSSPDTWALDQLFPVLPVTRLNEEPTERATLCDITCDSDGQIDKFVDLRDVKQALELHAVNSEPYYLAMTLIGAYQESLGMNHNLLGSVNEAHFLLDDAGRPHLDKVIRGESLHQVLASAGYETQSLLDGFRHALNSAQVQARVSPEERESLMDSFRSTLDSYTYLED